MATWRHDLGMLCPAGLYLSPPQLLKVKSTGFCCCSCIMRDVLGVEELGKTFWPVPRMRRARADMNSRSLSASAQGTTDG